MSTRKRATTMEPTDNTTPTTDPQENGTAIPAVSTPRPETKRKFTVTIGSLTFTKRCTCKQIAEVLSENQGANAVLELDGYVFAMVNVA